ncbi:O-antigen ligase family protein [candidate division KSB1 bacterium]|nr:O-antigen ligase family protein [candidate division KSB1 bacterium]
MSLELGWGVSEFIPPILYTISIIVIIATLAGKKEIGIYFFVFFLPIPNLLEWTEKFPIGKDLNDIVLFSLLIRWYIDSRKSVEPFMAKTPFNTPIFILIAWMVIEYIYGAFYLGIPMSPTPSDSRFMALKNYMTAPLIFFIIVNNVKDPKQIRTIIYIMLVSILFLNRNSINLMKGQDFSHYSNDLKVIGVGSSLSGNSLAVFYAMYTIVLASIAWHVKELWQKILFAVPTVLSYFSAMFLFSRSGYFAIAVTGAFWGIMKSRKILIILIIGVLIYKALLPNAVRERLEMTKSEEGYDRTSEQRFGMWDIGFDIIKSNPLLGAGFEFTQQFNVQLEKYGERTWHSFHNSYVQQAVETGLVGLGLYLFLFFLAIMAGWKLYLISNNGLERGVGFGLIGTVLACMAGNFAGSYWNYLNLMGFYWVLIALVARMTINIEQPEKTEKADEKEITDINCIESSSNRLKRKFDIRYL